MFEKLKRIWKSYYLKESDIKKGLVIYGPASIYLENIDFEQDSKEWKDSIYSCKLLVDSVRDNLVFYYSFYIDREKNEFIQKYVKYIDLQILVKSINELKLLVE